MLSTEKYKANIFVESVFALSLRENVEVFDNNRTTNSTHFLFRLWPRCIYYTSMFHIYSSVGYRIVIVVIGLSTTFT